MDGVYKVYSEYFESQSLIRNSEEYFHQRIHERVGFFSESIALLLSPSISERFAKLLGVVLRPLIRAYWQGVFCPQIEKDRILQLIFTLLETNFDRMMVIKAVSLILSEILIFEDWKSYLPTFDHWGIIANASESYDMKVSYSVIFLTILECSEDRAQIIVPLLLPVLYQLFVSDEVRLQG